MLPVLGVTIGIALLACTDAKGATVTEHSFPPSTVETWASATGENGTGATATAKRSSMVETLASATGENGTGATATAKRSSMVETLASTTGENGTGAAATAKRSSTVETLASATGENGTGATATAKRSLSGETSGSTGESSASFTRVNDSTEVVINFRLDKVVYDPAYMGNNERFNELMRLLAAVKADPDTRLKNIRITSSASPEGPYKHNVELSIERGKTLIKLIKKQDPTLNDDIFVITSLGEAWDGAIKAVEEGDMPHKDEALEIMRNTPENVIKDGKVVDTRKRQMMNLAGGTVWRYMIENYFPSLRQTSVFVVFKTKRLVSTLEELAPIYACVQPKNAPGELARGEVFVPAPVVERKPIIAVKPMVGMGRQLQGLGRPRLEAGRPLLVRRPDQARCAHWTFRRWLRSCGLLRCPAASQGMARRVLCGRLGRRLCLEALETLALRGVGSPRIHAHQVPSLPRRAQRPASGLQIQR